MADKQTEAPKPEEPRDVGRRQSLRYLAALGGGALTAAASLGAPTEAQRRGRRQGGGRRPRQGPGTQPAKTEAFAEAFRSIRQSDASTPEACKTALDEAELRGPDRVAAAQTLAHAEYGAEWVDLGVIAGHLLAGMGLALRGRSLRGLTEGVACGGGCDPSDIPSATPDIVHSYKGNDCGSDCGEVDGIQCGFDCKAREGHDCGGGCIVSEGVVLEFDTEGVLVGSEDFVGPQDLVRFGLALTNAAEAYGEVFGVTHPGG